MSESNWTMGAQQIGFLSYFPYPLQLKTSKIQFAKYCNFLICMMDILLKNNLRISNDLVAELKLKQKLR